MRSQRKQKLSADTENRFWQARMPRPPVVVEAITAIECAPDRAAADAAVAAAIAGGLGRGAVQRAYRRWLTAQAYRRPVKA